VTHRRLVRVTDQFFERLDALLPAVRTPDGRPSTADFLLHEMPNVIDKLAVEFESATTPSVDEPDVRVLIAAGRLVRYYAVYAVEVDDGSVEVLWLDVS